jgi:RNA polymerase sigma factor (TIGR02999 family)
MQQTSEVTQLLLRLREGDRSVIDQLTPLLYDQLRRLAQAMFRQERSNHTLQPTALINEAYIRLVDQERTDFETRAHFLRLAARVMRQVLVDHARSNRAAKRGGGAKVQFDEGFAPALQASSSILALNDALDDLGRLSPRKAQAIDLRYFGGLSNAEIAEVLGISVPTLVRDLRMAEAWLSRYLTSPGQASAATAP